jgi:hypothetical protein
MTLKAIQVQLDERAGPYKAYTRGDLWNGFAIPAFTQETALQILNETRGISWYHDDTTDSFLIRSEGDDLGDPPYQCQGFAANTEDGPLWLYPIGAYFWTWQLADNDPKRRLHADP